MPKIKDIAHIIPSAPVKKVTRTMPENFKKILDQRQTQYVGFKAFVEGIVIESNQPLTVGEITHIVNEKMGESFSTTRVRYALDSLVESKVLMYRFETDQERTLRADGQRASSKPAMYFFRAGSNIPKRTVTEAVPGVILKSVHAPRPRKPKAPSKKAYDPKLVVDRPDTAALDFLIEKLVAERTAALQQELNEANAKLAQFKKLLG